MRLADDAKEIGDERTGRMHVNAVGTWIKQWWHRGGGTAVRQIFFVITRTTTVNSLGVPRTLGMRDALATYWVIHGRSPSLSDFVICEH